MICDNLYRDLHNYFCVGSCFAVIVSLGQSGLFRSLKLPHWCMISVMWRVLRFVVFGRFGEPWPLMRLKRLLFKVIFHLLLAFYLQFNGLVGGNQLILKTVIV